MAYQEEYSDDEDVINDNPNELYGVRDGILFVIDATPPMFVKSEDGESYFIKSIKLYEQILKQKMVWSRQDWMGLILFGTNKWDTDPEIKHVLTVQKLAPISIEHLKEVMKISSGKSEYGPKMACSTAYPLHDVLWHAAQAFSFAKLHIWMRRVILLTCQDDPPLTSPDEKHRIRVKAKSYHDISLQLYVVGLGDNWDHERFYKDLEMASGKIDNDDYRRTSEKDLVVQVKFMSRNMAKLPFRLGEDVILDVCLRTLTVKREYLKKESMSKEDNTPLFTQSILCKVSEMNQEDGEESEPPPPVLEDEIKMYQEFGNRKIYFTPSEVKFMCITAKPGIDLICAKPKSYHPMYHLTAPYFVTYNKSNRKDNRSLFGALLHKCEAKNLMLVCAVTLKEISAKKLCTMIPDIERGGFYLYQIPMKENTRELAEHFSEHIYDDEYCKPPTEPEGVALLEKIIRKLRIEYDPELFPNPKLQAQLQTLETMALDLEERELPPDATLPMDDLMRDRVASLLDEFSEMFVEELESESDGPSRKRSRRDPVDVSSLTDNKIRDCISSGTLSSLTVPQLKEILKNAGLKTGGKKEELLSRVIAHYE